MDITSYLLGKNASGGGGANLQTKSVSITQNGESTISPDEGYDGMSAVNLTVAVPSSGQAEDNDVNFYDYDGTRVYSYSKNEFLALTEMPANPSHTGLVAQGWNWSFQDAQSYVQKYGMLEIGQLYITDDNSTKFYIKTSAYKDIYFTTYLNGELLIDWGDNSQFDTLTGTSTSTSYNISHTYSELGEYTVRIIPNTENTQYSPSEIRESSLLTWSGTYQLVQKIEFGSNISTLATLSTLGRFAETITIPKDTTTNPNNGLFYNCYNIKCIILPSRASAYTSTFQNLANNCYSLSAISFPKTYCTKFGAYDNNFNNTKINRISLPETTTSFSINNDKIINYITFPDNITTIEVGLTSIKKVYHVSDGITANFKFNGSPMITDLVFPKNITTIPANGFKIQNIGNTTIKFPKTLTAINMNQCITSQYILYFDFSEHEQVVTLGGAYTEVFQLIDGAKIIVPDALYNDWIADANWSYYSTYIVKASEA